MEKYSLKFVYQYTFVAAVGGLLFGYDTAVVAGAIGFLQEKYSLSPAMTGWAASCALIGCMVGAMLAGILSDKLGRKKSDDDICICICDFIAWDTDPCRNK